MYPILDVGNWPVVAVEQIGDDPKDWLSSPYDGSEWLFKPRTERPDRVQGEDWSEKFAGELAKLLSVPAAPIELAQRAGEMGCLSRSVVPPEYSMQPGAVLLAEIVTDYEPRRSDRLGHSITNIRRVLAGRLPPPGFTGDFHLSAFDVFVGYLLLDALIANQDRHEENWAVLLPKTGGSGAVGAGSAVEASRLCASYDHATSLGFNLTDKMRARSLVQGVGRWANRGSATRLQKDESGHRPTLVDLVVSTFELVSPQVRTFWMDKLVQIREADLIQIAESIPTMSDVARTFAVSVLMTNRRRLIGGD